MLGSGSVRDHKPEDSAESRQGNDAPDRVTIALNTVRSSGTAIAGESMRTLPPLGCTISDNLLLGDAGKTWWTCRISKASRGPATSSGAPPPTETSPADSPERTRYSHRLRRHPPPHFHQPRNQRRQQAYPTVTRDLDGNPRTGKADVGADEYSTTTPTNHPLTPTDVGPQAP